LINFRMTGNHEKRLETVAREVGRTGQTLMQKGYREEIDLLGPGMAPYSKMKGRFRWQMLAKGKSSRALHQYARELYLLTEDKIREKGITLDIDVDPVYIL
jgi:primosomal protein N' (replication factor Y)